jgi:hypothetical protein
MSPPGNGGGPPAPQPSAPTSTEEPLSKASRHDYRSSQPKDLVDERAHRPVSP